MIKAKEFFKVFGSFLLAIIQLSMVPLVFMLILGSIDQSMKWLGLDVLEEWFGIQIEEQKWRLLMLFCIVCAIYIVLLKVKEMITKNLLNKEIHFFWSMKKISIKNPFFSEYLAEKDRKQKELLMEEGIRTKILDLEKMNEDLEQKIINLKYKYQYPLSMIHSVKRLIRWITEAIKSPITQRHMYHQLLDVILAELNNTEVLQGSITQAAIYVLEGDKLAVHGNYCLEHQQVQQLISPNEGFEGSIFAQNQIITLRDTAELSHDYTINKSNFKSIIGYPFGLKGNSEPEGMIVLYLTETPEQLDIIYTNLMLYSELISSVLDLRNSDIIKERKEV